jgi:DNA-binding MurR/RpiR family transcriptional regulator
VIETITIPQILAFIEAIKKSETIYVFARGLTELVAEEFALKLQLLGFKIIFIKDPNIMKILSKKAKQESLILIFSLNGETKELIESAQNARWAGAKVAVYCRSGRRSMMAAEQMLEKGYVPVNLDGGILAWQEAAK